MIERFSDDWFAIGFLAGMAFMIVLGAAVRRWPRWLVPGGRQ